jgi:hypothetical protein
MNNHIPNNILALGCVVLLSATLAACSNGDSRLQAATEALASASASEGAAARTAAAEHLIACAMVTEDEMSSILGSAVVGTANDRSSGKTECIYQVASGIGPYVELAVDWGGGEAAMTAMKVMGSLEPGLANPYDGLGDQASQVGPVLMIRTGEDLVMLTFSGVEDSSAKARKIFDTAKARM